MLLEIIERKSYPTLPFDKKLLENISPLRGKQLASKGYLYSHEFFMVPFLARTLSRFSLNIWSV